MTPSPMRRPRIVVLGSINMDLIVRTAVLPSPGQTVLGSATSTEPGGKGANQAVAAARAGADVTIVAAVGDDGYASALLDWLRAEGLPVDLVRRLPGPSGLAVITVDDAAENTIVVASGANHRLGALAERDERAIADADLLVLQLELPLPLVAAGARLAADGGVPVLLNASPAQPLAAELLDSITVLVVNEGEAAALGPRALAAVPHVVTTLGAAGATWRGPGAGRGGRRPEIAIPAPAVTAVDTTGAGDAFTGALAVSWAEGADPETALRFAVAAGALAVTRPGAGGAAPRRADIEAIIAGGDARTPRAADAAGIEPR